MLRKKLLVGTLSLCAVMALMGVSNVITSKADNSVQLTDVEAEVSPELEGVVESEQVEKPKFWKNYSTADAVYKVTLPLTNGMGNVTYVTPLSKEITEVEIPNEVVINGITYQVTSIEKEAFKDCDNLKKVDIGNKVKKIEKKAFANLPKLKKVDIGNNVKKIEKEAFKDCKNLKEIKIPGDVTYIGVEAFAKCDDLKKAVLGNSVKTISKKAFYDCGNLKKVQIGKSVKTIGKEAFAKCDELKEIRIKGSSLQKIGKEALKGIRSDAIFKIDSEEFDRISALFTPETGFEPTMVLEIKKGIFETLQDWMSDPEDMEEIEENQEEVAPVEPQEDTQVYTEEIVQSNATEEVTAGIQEESSQPAAEVAVEEQQTEQIEEVTPVVPQQEEVVDFDETVTVEENVVIF